MLTIVNQHPNLLQPYLAQQAKKLFIIRLFSENILVFLLQYTGLMISTLSPHFSPLWLASGTACGFIFMRGYSILPGIWLGSFVAYVLAGMSIGLACGCAIVFTLQPALILWLSYCYISPTLIFYQRWLLIKFILCSSVLTAVATFTLGFFYSLALHNIEVPFQLWLQWWLANFSSVLILSCMLMTWDRYFSQIDSLKKLNWRIVSLSYGLLLIFIIIYVFSNNPLSTILFSLVTLPLILFISVRFGWCGAMNAIFLLGILLTFATFFDAPLFESHFSTLPLQSLLIAETVLGLLIAI